jgi:thiosulfate reductase/polysulfide reductase chain A
VTATRREFIKIGGAAAGALAMGSALTTRFFGIDADPIPDPHTDGDRVIPTFCELCFWKCGVLAHVKDGRVTKITGNPAHPLSRGRLCPRGLGGVGLLYDPDRLKRPLLRRERRGAQVFDEADWPTALDFLAEKMRLIRDRHGPEAMALFTHGHGGSWFTRLMNAYGSASIAAPSYAQCRGPREAGFQLTFGTGLGSPEPLDLANARCIALIGSHLGENMHNTQVQDFARALERGAGLIVVDPRLSTAAGKANHWLPIKPGTDIALLLAWMHVIVEEKLYDRDYVEKHTVGFEKLRDHLRGKTPEWAFAETTLPPEKIVETARFLAAARPAALVHPGRRATWYGDDTQRSRAIAMLNALLGSWGRRGGIYFPSQMAIPKYPTPPLARKPVAASDSPRGVTYPFAEEVLASGLCEATIPAVPASVRGWLVYGSNLLQALPAPERTVHAIQALDLLAVVDVLPMEIAGWADVVLPEATYLERDDDVNAPPYEVPFVSIRQKVVDPMHDSKPGWWIAKELAQRLDLKPWFDFADGAAFARARVERAGLGWEELTRTGVAVGRPGPRTIEEGAAPAFATPSKKIELWSEQLAKMGFDPAPRYVPPDEPPPGYLRLLSGRAPSHSFGRTTNNRFLSEVYAENEVWVNARVARELGLKSGRRVVLVNQDGVRSEPVKLKATQRIRHDCVYLVHGYGHDAQGLTFARGRGASVARLTTRFKVDPLMGGTGMNVNFVRIERAGA